MTRDEFKRSCKNLRMTQEAVCALLGYSRSAAHRWTHYGFPSIVVTVLRLLADGTLTPDDIRRATNGVEPRRLQHDDTVRRAQ